MFSLSIAMDKNNGIGYCNKLPWHIKEELQLFKKNTINKNIIMGRTTYENLPGKLVNRTIYVVTTDESFHNDGCNVINDFNKFLIDHQDEKTEYVICGGSSIYLQAYPFCKEAFVSIVKGEYLIDRYFKEFNLNDWKIIEKENFELFDYYHLIRK